MTDWQKVADGTRWRWRHGDWLSASFEYLEERPWTPQIIGGRPCFSVREDGRWCVVWGDIPGRWYEDVASLSDVQGQPLYVAREGCEWLLVWGRRESQRFDHQITYDRQPAILQFDPRNRTSGDPIAPMWGVDT